MVTLKNIADQCNVSVSTVSRALAGSRLVSAKQREIIRDAARKLNYVPNISARTLAGGKSGIVGLLIMSVESNYYASIVQSIGRELRECGYGFMVAIGDYDYRNELEALRSFASRNMDGIILVGPFSEQLNENLPKLSGLFTRPAVIVQAAVRCDFATNITMDDRAGIASALQCLLGMGHKKFGFITEKQSHSRRLETFVSLLPRYGIDYNPLFIRIGNSRFEAGGYEAMNAMLEQEDRPTAVLFSSDNIAIGGLKSVLEHGLRVPGDISLVGYDGVKEVAYLPFALTTVVQPVNEMAHIAVSGLVQRLRHGYAGDNINLSVTPQLTVRDTTAPPRDA
ncbi:MAG: LacI family transcriptional regulator [Synergistaceae bacterium]|jgi:DNA-binding LacI/PurR family transcriptional regulator|nr:LacI family transcriptional regulator [Synergistaceae bacterium]